MPVVQGAVQGAVLRLIVGKGTDRMEYVGYAPFRRLQVSNQKWSLSWSLVGKGKRVVESCKKRPLSQTLIGLSSQTGVATETKTAPKSKLRQRERVSSAMASYSLQSSPIKP